MIKVIPSLHGLEISDIIVEDNMNQSGLTDVSDSLHYLVQTSLQLILLNSEFVSLVNFPIVCII